MLENPVSDVLVNEDFGEKTIDVSSVFSDGATSIIAISENSDVVTVTLDESNMLTITEVNSGSSLITLMAETAGGKQVYDDFNFTVNAAPVANFELADLTVNAGFELTSINLVGFYTDLDNDALTMEASSSNKEVVTVSLVNDTIWVTEVSTGAVTINVTTDDGKVVNPLNSSFTFRVNNIPEIKTPLNDLVVNVGFDSLNIDLSGTFEDLDLDLLSYSIQNLDTNILNVSVKDMNLFITEKGVGTDTVIVKAEDGVGGFVIDTFNVTVNAIPVLTSAILDIYVNEGFETLTLDLAETFSDADLDSLTIMVSSSDSNIVVVSYENKVLTATEFGRGISVITVTAKDGKGGEISEEFNFIVNGVPTLANPIADTMVAQGFSMFSIDISQTFSDPDGDMLLYTVSSDKPELFDVSINDTIIEIEEIGVGDATITISANDSKGGLISEEFTFSNNQTSINGINNMSVSMYPNPTNGLVNINIEDKIKGNVNLEIYSMLGNKVFEQEYSTPQKVISLDLSSFENGMYLIQIKDESDRLFNDNLIIK